MSVESCTLINPREITTALENKRTYTLTYRIKATAPNTFAALVLAGAEAAGPNPLPVEYAVLGPAVTGGYLDPNAFCLGVQLSQTDEDEKRLWIATATFGPLPENKTPMDAVTNPLNRPPRFWTENIEENEPVNEYYDDNGQKKLLRNGAGQEFIDPIMQERSFPVLAVQKNVANVQDIIAWNLEFEASVNEEEYQGGAPRTVKYLPIQSGQIAYEGGIAFYAAIARFAYKHDTWDRRIVNQGFHYLDDDGKLKRAKDKDGSDMVEPVLLTADGKLAPLDALGLPVDPSASIIVRNTRPLKDFSELGF